MKIIIPARSGSKRLPNKNMALILGKPLLYYTVMAALELSDEVYVSSDSESILAYAEALGAKTILRKPELCTDEVYAIEIWKDFIRNNECEYSAYMQPTTPFRDMEGIKEKLKEFYSGSYENGFSAYAHKGFIHKQTGNEIIRDRERVRTQLIDYKYQIEDGGFYIGKTSSILEAEDLIFGESLIFPSGLPIDIDTREDLEKARKYGASL